ncbi:MAG: hypothetical protein K6U89_19930, partial [Chloroflexi bacterium]|nr:hypothetical protein [Chloroflexota bacterium]
ALGRRRYGEELMRSRLEALDGGSLSLQTALEHALRIWALGARDEPVARGEDEEDGEGRRAEEGDEEFIDRTLRQALAEGTVEAAILQRNTQRESKFRLLGVRELEPLIAPYRRVER